MNITLLDVMSEHHNTTSDRRTMAASTSILCSIQCTTSSATRSSDASPKMFFSSPFLAANKELKWLASDRRLIAMVGLQHGRSGGAKCWFKFGKNGVDAEGAGIYGSQRRDEFSHYDVEQYFDYTGMLAVEGSYDRVEGLLKQNIAPVDILLMMAASEGDKTKIEEVMRAGARYDVKDADGKTALDRAESDEIRQMILGFSVQKA